VVFTDELLAVNGLLGTQSVGVGQRVAEFGVHFVEARAVEGARAVAVTGQEFQTLMDGRSRLGIDGWLDSWIVGGFQRAGSETGAPGLGGVRAVDWIFSPTTLIRPAATFSHSRGRRTEVPEVGDLAEEIKLADVDTLALAFEVDFGAFHVVQGLDVAVGKYHQ